MTAVDPIEQALRTEELRQGFLKYTREAYALLPVLDHPRILDIGCGSGLPTIELARLGGGEVVGMDPDVSALATLRRRPEFQELGGRVKTVNASLLDTALEDESFDVLWEEGVLHLLDSATSFPCCLRLLKTDGFLVMHETVVWFEQTREQLPLFGFSVAGQLLLPTCCWWTGYYAQLEERIRKLRDEHGDEVDASALAGYEKQVSMVKADPPRFDCGFYVVRKTRPG
jgi:SAM-dependent methyltransferase